MASRTRGRGHPRARASTTGRFTKTSPHHVTTRVASNRAAKAKAAGDSGGAGAAS